MDKATPRENLLEQNSATIDSSQSQLENQIASQVNAASPGADVDIEYRYERGPDGQLVATAATVTITEDVPVKEAPGAATNSTTPPCTNRTKRRE